MDPDELLWDTASRAQILKIAVDITPLPMTEKERNGGYLKLLEANYRRLCDMVSVYPVDG